MQTYKTESGEKITVGSRISAGGEGQVYDLLDKQGFVCKIYTPQNRTREREQKLHAMVKNKISQDKHPFLTWPSEILYSSINKSFAGYIMPRSEAEDALTRCINLAHRKKSTQPWAKTGERGLYYIAYNLALAFKACHWNNICIGDVNETNVMVTSHGLPVIIDNDSFQVPNLDDLSHPFLSPVVTPDFTPPERAGGNNSPIKPEQDNFGLAVIIYRLLHNGVHPFVSKDGSAIEHISDIPGRIKAHRFAHASNAGNRWYPDDAQLSRWRNLSEQTRNLFVRALDYQNHGINRPTAEEWKESLDQDIERLWPERRPERTLPERTLAEDPGVYQLKPSSVSKSQLKTCACSKCSCQKTSKYEFCNPCALNHEGTIIKCECSCQCENVHLRKYTRCYNCNEGRHRQGSRPQQSAQPQPSRYNDYSWDSADDLPF